MNTKAQFCIREHLQQFGVNCLALLLQDLQLGADLHPTLEQVIRRQVLQVRKWIWALRRQVLEKVLQGTRG
jgi:hypothetical protein